MKLLWSTRSKALMHAEPAPEICAAILCRCGDRAREELWAHPGNGVRIGCGRMGPCTPRDLPGPPEGRRVCGDGSPPISQRPGRRSEEHTSELQSRFDLVCRLLLEKKKIA